MTHAILFCTLVLRGFIDGRAISSFVCVDGPRTCEVLQWDTWNPPKITRCGRATSQTI